VSGFTPSSRRSGAAVPDRAECDRLLERYDVPAHIRRHSEQVARVARRLSAALGAAGVALDGALVEAAALLHDISKAACLQGGDHAREGAELLQTLGYPEVAALVGRHVELGLWEPDGQITEAEILNYSDKRVRHEEVVSLQERFEDLVERYGRRGPGAEIRIRRNWKVTEELEAKIFRRLPFGPEAVEGGDEGTGGR